MPELPEVHTTVTGLQKLLPDLTISDVWSDWPRQIKNDFVTFKNILKGSKIESVKRRGKNVLIHLVDGITLRVHMKMTGHLMYGEWEFKDGRWKGKTPGHIRDDPYNQYIHFVITLSNGYHLALCDSRKFGRIEVIRTDEMGSHPTIGLLGPEPLDKSLTPNVLLKKLQEHQNLPIKIALLNQNIIAGIGNIYADETLWASGIMPTRKNVAISLTEARLLLASMRKILTKSISIGGDSKSDYRNVYGERGGYQNFHKAYRQSGKRCTKRGCGGIIERIVLGGRSSHFCPVHQH